MSGYRTSSRKVDKPWGWELVWAEAEDYVGKLLFVRAGESLSLQYHEVKDESWLVQEGRARLELGEVGGELEIVEIAPGDTYRFRPRTVHRVTAVEDTLVIEVSTNHLTDVVRLEDKYGREGTSAALRLVSWVGRGAAPPAARDGWRRPRRREPRRSVRSASAPAARTTRPITVAVAGRIDTISAYVGRGEPRHRELVEDVRHDRGGDPDHDARQQERRVEKRRDCRPATERRSDDEGNEHCRREPVEPFEPRDARHAVCEHDVRGEEDGVRECEGDADGLGLELDVGQQVDAEHGQPERRAVPSRSGAYGGKRDDGKELDRRHRSQRQRVDGDVEARVHDGEDDSQRDDEPPRRAIHPGEGAPRPSPESEHRCRARDAQPCHAERFDSCEEEHRERRPEVVEYGTSDEVRLGACRRRASERTARSVGDDAMPPLSRAAVA